MKKLLLAFMCAAAGLCASAATFTYSHTFAKGEVAADAASYELSGVKWQTTAMEYVGFDTQNSKGLQIGSSGKPSTAWTISTDAFSGVTVTKVEVEGATASGGNATIDLKVGGAAFGNSAEIARDLSACTFTGSAKGNLAVNFTNGAQKAMYIKSITVTYEGNSQIGEGGSGETPVDPDPVETVGKGTAESPYTVDDVVLLNNPGTKAWVKGYIVGSAADKTADSFTTATGEEASATNVFIAASASETDYTKCIPVQLPAGAVREALNLQANPGNLGKEVTLYGSLEKYFGQSGVKTVTEYTIDGGGNTPVDPDPVETVGKGTAESPYTVDDVVLLNNPGTKAWVKGYIVGSAADKTADSFTTATGEEASATNVFIAASASETDYTKCIPVQLPAGEIREALNLQANPGNLGKSVTLYGSLEKYFGLNGVKTVTEYTLEGAVAPTYPEVADIASFLDEQPESFTSITSPVTVVYQNGLDLFVQDETGSMLVYGNLNDRTFKNGDQLTGLTGKFNVYHGMVQCAPVVSNFPEAVAGSPVKPAEVTLADVTVANLAKYVTISGLTANAETTGEGESARTVISVTDGTTSVEIYNRYGLENVAAATDVVITGFVYVYDSKMEIVPVEFKGDNSGISDVTADTFAADVIYDLQGRRVANPTSGLYIINGRKVLMK